ncbi:SMP-30/gluconolactonase/LRE family protein [Alteromonadaceae bacterium BrNp21-10]|nr:SMP-30/gluconolactonase/LRE family protein [Alteromonadaceae bacterium BrNp21-10]
MTYRSKYLLLMNAVAYSFISFSSYAENSAVEYLSTPVFTQGIEGPAVDRAGNLYAVNFAREGTIGIITSAAQASLYIDLPEGSTGNGIRFDQDGNMYIADYSGHNILRLSATSKKLEVYAHNSAMHQPNDIAISANGILYASDPNWQDNSGQLWMIDRQGQTTLLEGNMGTTNGIEVSHDEQHLYVNESVQRNIWQYDILSDGSLTNKRLFHHFKDHGLDGMRADSQGNLYVARYGKGVIAILSVNGELIKEITLTGQFPTNVAFGGEDGKQVFVTLQKKRTIDTFNAEFPGRSFVISHSKK